LIRNLMILLARLARFELAAYGSEVIQKGYPTLSRFPPFAYSLHVLLDISWVGFSLFWGLESSWLLYKNYTFYYLRGL